MSGEYLLYITIIIVGLIFSAFFSGSEAAFLSIQRARLKHLVSIGVKDAARVEKMLESPERLLSTILLGNNLVNVTVAAVVTALVISIFGESSLSLIGATAGTTTIVLIFGEVLPKTTAIRHSETISLLFARPLKGIEYVLYPFVTALQWLSRKVGFGSGDIRKTITEAEIRSLINLGEKEGTFEPAEADMLESVFRFGDRQAREVMTPRTEMVCIEHNTTLGEFLEIYSLNMHTRYPVFRGSTDNIVGILSVKNVLKAMATRDIPYGEPIAGLMRDALFIPETKPVADLFDEMRLSGNQMAILVDEFGGIAGLVTLKSLLEEVVGRVAEEGLPLESEYKKIGDNTYDLDGGMSIEEVNERISVFIPQGDFDTIAGFILHTLGHIPIEGEKFEYGDLTIQVRRMKDMKIESIRITKHEPLLKIVPE